MANTSSGPFLSALDMSTLYRSGQLSPVEVIETLFSRIAILNPVVNAFVELFPEGARAAARAAEEAIRGNTAGPLAGIPVSVKDLVEVAEGHLTYGSRAFRDYRPGFDCAMVQRLRRAGAVITGMTNTPEFSSRPTTENLLHGATRNPWDLERHPGGSSGGAAAAVAAGLGPLATGADGGGSCRIPGSCCGVVGFKPSRGRVSWAPTTREAMAGLATNGPIARTVRDAALMLDVIAGAEIGDPYEALAPASSFVQATQQRPQGLRIGWAVSGSAPVQDDVVRAVKNAISILEGMGHSLVDTAPDLDGLEEVWMAINNVGMAAWPIPKAELANVEANTHILREAGLRMTAVDYALAVNTARLRSARIMETWKDIDIFVSPTLSETAQPLGWPADFNSTWPAYMDFIQFTFPFNLTGQPAISIPCGFSGNGMPIGLQIVGRLNDDATVLALAAAFEEAKPWSDYVPQVVLSH